MEDISRGEITQVRKRDGRIVQFDKNKIEDAIFKAAKAVGGHDSSKSKELADKVINYIEESTEQDKIPNVEEVQDAVEKILIEEGHAKTAKSYILYRQKRKEIREAKAAIGIEDDLKLNVNAVKVLKERYLRKDADGVLIETPSEMFRRVAKNIASGDKKYDENADIVKTENEFYDLLTSLNFLPNSPTLMNAGTDIQQLSACFVLPVQDDMESIFEAVKNTALIHQSGGGTGFSFTNIRPKGDIVKSTGGVASGPISFMKVFNASTEVIKQGGKRRGANMGILRIDHPDILDFITAKEKEDSLNNFNISVAITNEFMEAIKNNSKYSIRSPRTGEVINTLDARRVFNLIVTMAWKNGEPGVIFIDKINKFNPTPALGEIESTNPCITGDTLISTEKGLERIDEIVGNEGLSVTTDNRIPIQIGNMIMEGKQGVSSNISSKIFSSGFKDVYKLTTNSGYELKATPDHKILTKRGWIELQNLKIDDEILIQSDEGMFSSDYSIRTSKFTEHPNAPEFIQEMNIKDVMETPMNHFTQVWSNELGQVLGWLVGDGWLREGKNCRAGFVLDNEMLDHFKHIINNLY